MCPLAAILFYAGVQNPVLLAGAQKKPSLTTDSTLCFLNDYCFFYICKHLPQMIRTNFV